MVTWKDIPGYEGLYQASSDGFIRRTKRKFRDKRGHNVIKYPKILKPSINDKGKFLVGLEKEGKFKILAVSKIIALTFIPNPNNYLEVVNLNGSLVDNRVENLAWIDRAYRKTIKQGHKIAVTDRNGNITICNSCKEVSNIIPFTRSYIHRLVKQFKKFKYNGYIVELLDN